jgi:hypothetical protein
VLEFPKRIDLAKKEVDFNDRDFAPPEVTLSQIRSECTGRDRFQAIVYLPGKLGLARQYYSDPLYRKVINEIVEDDAPSKIGALATLLFNGQLGLAIEANSGTAAEGENDPKLAILKAIQALRHKISITFLVCVKDENDFALFVHKLEMRPEPPDMKKISGSIFDNPTLPKSGWHPGNEKQAKLVFLEDGRLAFKAVFHRMMLRDDLHLILRNNEMQTKLMNAFVKKTLLRNRLSFVGVIESRKRTGNMYLTSYNHLRNGQVDFQVEFPGEEIARAVPIEGVCLNEDLAKDWPVNVAIVNGPPPIVARAK